MCSDLLYLSMADILKAIRRKNLVPSINPPTEEVDEEEEELLAGEPLSETLTSTDRRELRSVVRAMKEINLLTGTSVYKIVGSAPAYSRKRRRYTLDSSLLEELESLRKFKEETLRAKSERRIWQRVQQEE